MHTTRQQANVFSRNAISTGDAITRRCQRVLDFLTQLQVVGVADEVAEVEEHFLIVLECFNEAEVVLKINQDYSTGSFRRCQLQQTFSTAMNP